VPLHVALGYLAEAVGFGAAVALTAQPWRAVRDLRKARDLRDQAQRFQASGEADQAADTIAVAEGLEQSVGRWDLFDSRLIKFGGIALAVSFVVKLLALYLTPPA
jgi:uncharacterized membrane protein YcjF (UPF0283 family)